VEWPRGEATACKAVYTGSNPVSTSKPEWTWAIGAAVARFPDTEEVTGSIPVSPTRMSRFMLRQTLGRWRGRAASIAGMTSIWTGKCVRLRGIEPEDWSDFQRFDLDAQVQRNADMIHPPRSVAGSRQWAEEQSTRQPENDQFQLAIESLDGQVLVGALSTGGTDQRTGRAALSQGRGRDLLVQHGLARAARHLGFQREGQLRDHEFLGGRYYDLVIMGITADEFAASQPFSAL
jgi:hypothetical protein